DKHKSAKNSEIDIPVFFPNKEIKLNSEFVDYINFGGFPEVIFSEEARNNIQKSVGSDVVDKVLLKDLPGMYGISDTQELNSFFVMLAIRTGEETSYESLSRRTGIEKAQIKKYLEYLESAFLIKTIDRIDLNAKKFKRRNRFKIYLTNPSLRSALVGAVDENDNAMGNLVETAIFAQYFHEPRKRLHYAREKSGKWEIDLAVLKPDLSVGSATEIKWTDRISQQQLDNIVGFCHKHNLDSAVVTTKTLRKTEKYQSVEIGFVSSAWEAFFQSM
ncbi:MAG: ATP-binding protein, partial [Caldisericia bacterium]|nr:ATP-binding protein [Caldisericia bacterium]